MPITTDKERARITQHTATARTISYGRLPVKRTINLVTANDKPISWALAIPSIILIIAAAAAFGKFAVMDQLTSVYEVQREVLQLQRQLDEGNARIAAYQEAQVEERYAHFSWEDFTAQELSWPDYLAAMDLLERIVMPQTTLEAWAISGNELTLTINGSTLQAISQIVEQINNDEHVNRCEVTTAAMNSYTTSSENVLQEEIVTANLVIHLRSASREVNAG